MSEANQSRRVRGLRSLVPASAWATLAQQGVRSHHRAQERLVNQGDSSGWVSLCLAGRLKVVYAEPDGREIMLAVRGPGDVIGELSWLDGHTRSATVQAIEPGITAKLSRKRFDELVQSLAIGGQMSSYMLGKLRESAAHAWRLAHRTTAARLTDLIAAFLDAAGPDHPCPTTIAMPQEELASTLGLARSAITPVLAEWKAAGLITTGRGRLEVVDVSAFTGGPVSTSGQNRS
ncbi:Crp/Fnr family transcriptional regulator [Allokutzneria oryzae]|uniref:Crp/Fnr family transcriptional regulator n=1 Tax=Allokutzneria oryzae TaxID=1378989 RepID=A0ABV5ZX97_9PSEU